MLQYLTIDSEHLAKKFKIHIKSIMLLLNSSYLLARCSFTYSKLLRALLQSIERHLKYYEQNWIYAVNYDVRSTNVNYLIQKQLKFQPFALALNYRLSYVLYCCHGRRIRIHVNVQILGAIRAFAWCYRGQTLITCVSGTEI